MSYIAVDKLKQGMVVDHDVCDINQRLLISKGQELSEKHLRILKIWGVAEISVVADGDAAHQEAAPTDVEKARRIKGTLDFILQQFDVSGPTIRDVYQLAFLYRYRLDSDPEPISIAQRFKEDAGKKKIPNIREKIQRIDVHLPEAPELISELNAVISDPLGTSHDIAQVVNKSPSLAALLLKLVNSAFYGFPAKIDRISRAVSLIGSKEISNLALGLCVMRAFDDISPDVIELPAFMQHSVTCGLMARIMGARVNMKETEQLFVAGLLHDIGKLIVYKYFPDGALEGFAAAAAANEPVYRAEKKALGLYHTQIGKMLLRKWQLPAELEDVIVHHHNPAQAAHPGKAVIVQMADMLVHTLGVGSSAEWMVPHFNHHCWSKLGLANSSLTTIIQQALHQLQSIDTAFNPR
jgi:putative nucleotidyltransferase with HDIG domain